MSFQYPLSKARRVLSLVFSGSGRKVTKKFFKVGVGGDFVDRTNGFRTKIPTVFWYLATNTPDLKISTGYGSSRPSYLKLFMSNSTFKSKIGVDPAELQPKGRFTGFCFRVLYDCSAVGIPTRESAIFVPESRGSHRGSPSTLSLD